jgi:aryl sulfotransferase
VVRHLPNILFVHYNDLLADTEAEMRRIAAFLDIEINEATMPQLLADVGIDSMRREHADLPVLPQMFHGGATTFVYKGTNGRWRQTLLDDDLAMYESAAASLDPGLRRWLEHGTPSTTP